MVNVMDDIVFVKGNILITTKKFYYKELICYVVDENYDFNASIVVKGDLVIDDSYKSSVFTTYCATGEIASYYESEETWSTDAKQIFGAFRQNLVDIQQLLRIVVDNQELKKILYRQSFIGIIGAMEILFSDILMCFVNEKKDYFICFENKIDLFKRLNIIRMRLKHIENVDERYVRDIIRKINYHDLFCVKTIYKEIFEIEFPDIEKMKEFINIRHYLVHRNGKNLYGYEVDITDELLLNLIKDMNAFIEDIAIKLKIFE